jgi:hypothetical protein
MPGANKRRSGGRRRNMLIQLIKYSAMIGRERRAPIARAD